jgi:hypothetical protein
MDRARDAGVPESRIRTAGDAEDPNAAKAAIIKLVVEAMGSGHPIYDSTDGGLLEAINAKAQEDERDKGAPGLDANVIEDNQGPPRNMKKPPAKPPAEARRKGEKPDAAQTWYSLKLVVISIENTEITPGLLQFQHM